MGVVVSIIINYRPVSVDLHVTGLIKQETQETGTLDEISFKFCRGHPSNRSPLKIRNIFNFAGIQLVHRFNQTGFIEHIWRTELAGANLSGTTLADADLSYTLLAFSNLRGADLSRAVLKNADLTRADLTGADLTSADLTGADLYGANLTGVRGLETALGLESARNFEKAIR